MSGGSTGTPESPAQVLRRAAERIRERESGWLLAVAGLLEAAATDADAGGVWLMTHAGALKVARAYLGEETPA